MTSYRNRNDKVVNEINPLGDNPQSSISYDMWTQNEVNMKKICIIKFILLNNSKSKNKHSAVELILKLRATNEW